MKEDHDFEMALEVNNVDRRIIHVDVPPAHAGIMGDHVNRFEGTRTGDRGDHRQTRRIRKNARRRSARVLDGHRGTHFQ